MAALTTRRVMLLVLAALVPGIAMLCWFYGPAYLPRIGFAALLGLVIEAAALAAQRRPLAPTLTDGSTLLTCVLVTIALPPTTALSVLAVAIIAAVGLGKHVYGGLGGNPFNPAVVGYAVVLVSFPAELARWPALTDALSGATALTALRHRDGQTVSEVFALDPAFGSVGGYGWEWINLAFLAGGIALMALRLAAWRVPVALLATLGLAALLGYDGGSSRSLGSPAFHWLSGGTCLAACFFATDPVTHPVTARGQILFGCLIGLMAFVVRGFGNYPDGIAFGILLANAATPYLDRRLTREPARG
ncbi:MAG: RnfABCDGE type electron transport complex subunit D [Pseudomonadales bacterium]